MRRVWLTIGGIVAAVLLSVVGYKLVFEASEGEGLRVKKPEQAVQTVLAVKGKDDAEYGAWIGARMTRLCGKAAGANLSFGLAVIEEAPPRKVDRYDVSVESPTSDSRYPRCPKKTLIATVWSDTGEVLGIQSTFSPKFAGPELPAERTSWLNEFRAGVAP